MIIIFWIVIVSKNLVKSITKSTYYHKFCVKSCLYVCMFLLKNKISLLHLNILGKKTFWLVFSCDMFCNINQTNVNRNDNL